MDKKIEDILVEFLRENCLPQKTEVKMKLEDNLFNTGILDSAGLLHFVGFIEKKFDIIISDDDLIPEKFTTITSIANYIRSRIQEPAMME